MSEADEMLIEIVSDVVCPWCFIGLARLDAALAEIRAEFPALRPVRSEGGEIGRWGDGKIDPRGPWLSHFGGGGGNSDFRTVLG